MLKEQYNVLGAMSGTSLDGLDLALCSFTKVENYWNFEILDTQTIPYNTNWQKRLISLETGTALDYVKTDWDLGRYFGEQINLFLKSQKYRPQHIASHGHTIFHQPDANGYTAQIGNGAAIATITKTPVINNFRIADVALGGEGAPLVPIGDHLLFADYQFCLNLGGIANISTTVQGIRKAYDVCACNMVLNYLANKIQLPYDEDGKIAASGQLQNDLLQELHGLPFFKKTGPKSLGKEWFLAEVKPILEQSQYSIADQAHTFVHHIVLQLAQTCEQFRDNIISQPKMLVTGGGAYHHFLIDTLKKALPWLSIEIPSAQLVEFKEALIFAFLGVLRIKGENNCLKAVTGASVDNMGGVIHQHQILNP